MAGLPPSLILPAGTAIRLPVPVGTDSAYGTAGRPVTAVFPPPPPREDSQTRQPRQNHTDNRGNRTRAAAQAPSRQSPPGGAFAGLPDGAAAVSGNGSFLAQLLGQRLGPAGHAIALHRDGPALGSEFYRRAGGEPALYSEEPRILRISA